MVGFQIIVISACGNLEIENPLWPLLKTGEETLCNNKSRIGNTV